MIVSASKRSDIPAFYSEWFLNRLDAGYSMVKNSGGKPYKVSLRREDVDGFVFWTKNVGPFLESLAIVHGRGYPFYILHTINGYPASLEPAVPPAEVSVLNLRKLAELYGPDAAVWRYDPIVITPETPGEWHVANFARLAEALRGATNEAVISFVDDYRKMARNMARAGVEWSKQERDEKRVMAAQLAAIARENRMQLTLCCEGDVIPEGARASRCINAARIELVGGPSLSPRPKPCRAGCGCCESRDIGAYDTCVHGCRYCYATNSLDAAEKRHQAHDPSSEFLG